MARWPMLDDRHVIDIATRQKEVEHGEFFIDLNSFSEAHGELKGDRDCSVINVIPNEVQCCFDQFLHGFLKKISAHDSFLPIPPILGNGQPVDLKTLFLVVMDKGGYDVVSKNNLWNLVGEKSGLGVSVGSPTKLIYCKYLGILEKWLIKFSEGRVFDCSFVDNGINFAKHLKEFQAKVEGLLSNYATQEVGDKMSQSYDFKSECDYLNGRKLFDTNGVNSGVQDGGHLDLDTPRNLYNIDDTITLKEFDRRKMIAKNLMNKLDIGDLHNNNEVNNVRSLSDRSKGFDNDDDVLILDPSTINKENFGRKRKRKSMLEMLSWVTSIAKNPHDLVVDSKLERSKWTSQSNEEIRKQVLLFREAVFMKRNVESSNEQHDWQGKKMHPCMYDDNSGTIYNPSERLKCYNKRFLSKNSTSTVQVSSKLSIGTQGDLENTQSPHTQDLAEKISVSSVVEHSKIAIPLGPTHQAFVLEWTGMTFRSDPKWLGTQIWPLKSVNHRLLIERDPIGKGRNDLCGCQMPGSVECVKFHIVEKRAKAKLELDVAFYQWNFNKVGEEVSHYWTNEEEKKFKDVMQLSRSSHEKGLWDRILRLFSHKSREDLVSYYFNVFVLRCRRFQNRHSPNNIDSDDDESEPEPLIKSKAIQSIVKKK